jgi:hypothetical protein
MLKLYDMGMRDHSCSISQPVSKTPFPLQYKVPKVVIADIYEIPQLSEPILT